MSLVSWIVQDGESEHPPNRDAPTRIPLMPYPCRPFLPLKFVAFTFRCQLSTIVRSWIIDDQLMAGKFGLLSAAAEFSKSSSSEASFTRTKHRRIGMVRKERQMTRKSSAIKSCSTAVLKRSGFGSAHNPMRAKGVHNSKDCGRILSDIRSR